MNVVRLTGPVQCCLFRGDCSQTETPGLSTPRETDRTSSEPNSPYPPQTVIIISRLLSSPTTQQQSQHSWLLLLVKVWGRKMLALVATKLACSLRNILLFCGLYCLHYSYIQSCDLKIMWIVELTGHYTSSHYIQQELQLCEMWVCDRSFILAKSNIGIVW